MLHASFLLASFWNSVSFRFFRASFRDGESLRLRLPRPFHGLAMTELMGFMEKRDAYSGKNDLRCLLSKEKRFNFMSLRGAQRRGNLKAGGMASRNEARKHETTEFPNSDPSQSDATTALLPKRRFARAQRTDFVRNGLS